MYNQSVSVDVVETISQVDCNNHIARILLQQALNYSAPHIQTARDRYPDLIRHEVRPEGVLLLLAQSLLSKAKKTIAYADAVF